MLVFNEVCYVWHQRLTIENAGIGDADQGKEKDRELKDLWASRAQGLRQACSAAHLLMSATTPLALKEGLNEANY